MIDCVFSITVSVLTLWVALEPLSRTLKVYKWYKINGTRTYCNKVQSFNVYSVGKLLVEILRHQVNSDLLWPFPGFSKNKVSRSGLLLSFSGDTLGLCYKGYKKADSSPERHSGELNSWPLVLHAGAQLTEISSQHNPSNFHWALVWLEDRVSCLNLAKSAVLTEKYARFRGYEIEENTFYHQKSSSAGRILLTEHPFGGWFQRFAV